MITTPELSVTRRTKYRALARQIFERDHPTGLPLLWRGNVIAQNIAIILDLDTMDMNWIPRSSGREQAANRISPARRFRRGSAVGTSTPMVGMSLNDGR